MLLRESKVISCGYAAELCGVAARSFYSRDGKAELFRTPNGGAGRGGKPRTVY